MTQPKQKPGLSGQVFRTPENFTSAVKRLLGIGIFAHDFAADETNTQAERYFDTDIDALSLSPEQWRLALENPRGPGKGWGWLNPPFAKIGPWAEWCMETGRLGGNIAFLVPAGVGANWFRDYVDGHARVLFLNGRLAFMPEQPTWLYPKDCVLCLYGPHVAPGYEVWDWRGQH